MEQAEQTAVLALLVLVEDTVVYRGMRAVLDNSQAVDVWVQRHCTVGREAMLA